MIYKLYVRFKLEMFQIYMCKIIFLLNEMGGEGKQGEI